MIYQEHAHRKLRQAFDAILQQFSSNGNRKSMLSANRSFQAQHSARSTLLQTMLLYETCIVLSRKCLWDVNKDFWHQWRSLVITTLSARAIYRQIPVSYLQTWYIEINVFSCKMIVGSLTLWFDWMWFLYDDVIQIDTTIVRYNEHPFSLLEQEKYDEPGFRRNFNHVI